MSRLIVLTCSSKHDLTMPEGILVPTGGEYKHQPVQSLRVGLELMDPAKRWKLNVVLQRLFLLGAPKATWLTMGEWESVYEQSTSH